MIRQQNRIQWFDMITGQGDRHANNYMVQVKKDDLSVTTKAIDNDASYGIIRQGLHKFRFEAGTAARVLLGNVFTKVKNDALTSQGSKDLTKAFRSDPGVKMDADGSIEFDLSKEGCNVQFLLGLLHGVGMRNVAPPEEIDRELYDNLIALAGDAPDGGKAHNEYLGSLAERLGRDSAQYRAAVSRLDESIEHARKLMRENQVYDALQWEDHEVQRSVAAPNLKNRDGELDTYGVALTNPAKESLSKNSRYVGYTNAFFRDFLEPLVTAEGGRHSDWFD